MIVTKAFSELASSFSLSAKILLSSLFAPGRPANAFARALSDLE
jgi:hypothetical protein